MPPKTIRFRGATYRLALEQPKFDPSKRLPLGQQAVDVGKSAQRHMILEAVKSLAETTKSLTAESEFGSKVLSTLAANASQINKSVAALIGRAG